MMAITTSNSISVNAGVLQTAAEAIMPLITATGLFPDLSVEPFLLQRGEHFLVVEIALDFKRLGTFGRGTLFYAFHGFERVIHRLDALGATEMHSFNMHGLDLGASCAGPCIHAD